MSRNTVKSRNHKHDSQTHIKFIIKMQKGNIKNFGRVLLLSTVMAAGFSSFEAFASAAGASLRPTTQSHTESSSTNSEEEDAAEAFAQHRSRMLELLGTEGTGEKRHWTFDIPHFFAFAFKISRSPMLFRQEDPAAPAARLRHDRGKVNSKLEFLN